MPILDKPIRDYFERFGHGPPLSLVKSYAQGWTSEEEILGPIAEALRTGVPVKEWVEYRAPPGSLEEALLQHAAEHSKRAKSGDDE